MSSVKNMDEIQIEIWEEKDALKCLSTFNDIYFIW